MPQLSFLFSKRLPDKYLFILGVIIVITFVALPLFFKFPYRINIFLSFEGAYRLYLGQVPHQDFYLPMGIAYWLIPFVFFEIFSPHLFTLIISQVFINFISVLALYSILKNFNLPMPKILISVFIYCLTFVFINFWPWYNHTVFVFQLIGLAFLISFCVKEKSHKYHYTYIVLSALFIALSFFSKQDGGGLAIVLSLVLIGFYTYAEKKILPLGIFIGCLVMLIGLYFILFPDLGYWFNYGQEPHSSRLRIFDFLNDIFRFSTWEKFYVIAIILIIVHKYNDIKIFLKDKVHVLFFLFTLGILIQATLIQVTSYIPHNVNVYFHSIALAFIFKNIQIKNVSFRKPIALIAIIFAIMFWWSGDYWKYLNPMIRKVYPEFAPNKDYNIVSKYTWQLKERDNNKDRSQWIESEFPAFDRILMPKSTVEGIKNLKEKTIFSDSRNLKVLNMSELTALAPELGFTPLKDHPLWYHKNVSIFEQEIEIICNNISKNYYDVVLYEYIPNLNNFYPFEIRHCLQEYYSFDFKFEAPREESGSFIEVYLPVKPMN